jgi:MATE family multidrug resistance protein
MEFTDRVFLANYSIAAISAATPAGISAFFFMAFLGGIGSYCGVFIAQYHGSGQPKMIGSVLWQGIYFCLLSGLLMVFISMTLTEPFFSLVGHAPEVRQLEEVYFRILSQGTIFHIGVQTLSAFFIGLGRTKPVMTVNIIAMAVNIPLDYCLINGIGPLPELGIAGAGIATIFSLAISTLLLIRLIFSRSHIHHYGLYRNRRFDPALFKRLLRFGLPGTMQFSLDIFAFTVFILLVGRIGTMELAATNIVIAINSIAFMPSMGASQGVSVMVGQALGRGKSAQAGYATWSAIHLLMLYILCIDLLFIFLPELPLQLFVPAEPSAEYAEVSDTSLLLLRIVACYLFFDSLYMLFSGVLRGAGDTRFLMWSAALISALCFLAPLFVGIELLGFGVFYSWSCVLFFVFTLFCTVAYRYRQGKWRKMLVIDQKMKTP